MNAFIAWEDDNKADAVEVTAESMAAALDVAAAKMGFVDYADMAQERGWGENDGLNIEAA